ncbi:hypothetical protein MUG84_00530 [Paenibacillus sp. KQZ6P-2]|uniref:Glycoside hydrolase family 38 N-terminal domain-containing protein n=1 Tax=Paenibacillus mangrovi TaxID=2931978 RepID=A0A9X1WLU7_9BACL|nr:hypothetical protein [Paenibacillus mangrovi]MCJ8010225.1 hypothetical protein [Paenibacillus mangrovi]
MQSRNPFTLFVIQHAHIDIGYTERQEVITEYQKQFIEQAVDMALSPAQQTRDANTQFKFMCEGFWAVEQYLSKTGSVGKARLVEAIKNGSIELSAFYLHLTELLDEGHLRDTLKPATEFARREDVPLVSAMACDINGFSWGIVDALYEAGIKYLSTNINTHHGGCPFGKPNVPFYWESPKGNRILVWNGLTYHKANLLGIMPGFNYVGHYGIPGMEVPEGGEYIDIQDVSVPEKTLFSLVDGLRKNGYEYSFIPLMGSGLYTDNSPPTDSYCELIRQWNDKHGDQIFIRTVTLSEFFAHLEKEVSNIPVFRGDWNDWWTDGVISTALETSLFRNAQRMKRIAERLDPERRFVSEDQLKSVTKELVLYAEHTWGHSASLGRPADFRVQQLLMRKIKYAIEADRLACTALDTVLAGKGQGAFTSRRPFAFKVINPSIEPKTSLAYLPLDYWENPIFKKQLRVVDAQGRQYEFERVWHSLRGQELCIQLALEPLEERELTIDVLDLPNGSSDSVAQKVVSQKFENDLLRVEWDDDRGIYSVLHKPSGADLLQEGGPGLCTPLYQVFNGANRCDPAGFGYSARKIPEDKISRGELKLVTCTGSNRMFETWEFEYEVPGAHSYTVEFKFYRSLSRFDISIKLNKVNILDPEGMYAVFPFQVDQGIWHLDKAGAAIRPGIDQLPGTCCDYYSVQEGAALVGSGLGISLSTQDAPMVHIGKLRLWNYSEHIEPTGTLYSWLTNNKWDTNFKAACGGFYEFRYTVDVHQDYADSYSAIRACQENNYDFLAIRK